MSCDSWRNHPEIPIDPKTENWKLTPWVEYSHKNNCVFWPRTEKFLGVDSVKVTQEVVEELVTTVGYWAASSSPDEAWVWWVVYLREELGIPILQTGHGHRKVDGGLACLDVIWLTGPGDSETLSDEKMKKFAELAGVQVSDIEEFYGDGGHSV